MAASQSTTVDPLRSCQARAAEPRILFITHTGQIGGAEVCLLSVVQGFEGDVLLFQDGSLRERLLRQGTPVRLLRASPDLRTIRRDGSLLRVIPRMAGVAALVFQIASAARRYDLVYCNTQKSFVLGAIAAVTHRGKLLWHLHDILDRSHFGRAQIRLVVALANWRATRVVVPSKAVADAFIAAGGRASLTTVIANGIEPQVASASTAPHLQSRGHPDRMGGFVFGIFSRLAPWKGQHVAIEALARMPQATCVIAGAALFGEEEYARNLRALAQRLGVSERVEFLGQREDVAALMREVDVVVHPSIGPEPFGLTIVEAMLAGTPVVASHSGAAAEILDGGRLGRLVPPGDAPALADALEECRRQREVAARDAVAAQRHAEQNYTAARLRRDMRQVVVEILRS